jgi:hypothetical protein
VLSSEQFENQNGHPASRKENKMEIGHDLMSVITALNFRNIIWAFPYLAVMGMIWGYLAAAASGAVIGLLGAVVTSVIIGSTTKIFSESSAGSTLKPRDNHPEIIPDRLEPEP